MKTIIPIKVADTSTEKLKEMTALMANKYNQAIKIDFYHNRCMDYRYEEMGSSAISKEIEVIFKLLGQSSEPYFIISTQPKPPLH